MHACMHACMRACDWCVYMHACMYAWAAAGVFTMEGYTSCMHACAACACHGMPSSDVHAYAHAQVCQRWRVTLHGCTRTIRRARQLVMCRSTTGYFLSGVSKVCICMCMCMHIHNMSTGTGTGAGTFACMRHGHVQMCMRTHVAWACTNVHAHMPSIRPM